MRKTIFTLGLMLAAALSLTSCSKNEEVNFTPELKPSFELFANLDSRTTNDGIHTNWVPGDEINVFHAVAGTEDYVNDTPYVDGAGTPFVTDGTGKFKGTLAEKLTAEAYDWYTFYPYSSYIKTPANTSSGYMSIGCESDEKQIQSGNDNMSHIADGDYPLYGVAKSVAASEKPQITMKHLTSLLAFDVYDQTGEGFVVESIAFTAPEDIVGTYYINFAAEPVVYTGSGDTYVSSTATLKVENGDEVTADGAIFYMGIKPFTAKANSTLTVKITTDKGTFEKSITLTKDTTFAAGKFKTITVNVNEIVGNEPSEPGEIMTIAEILAAGQDAALSGTIEGVVVSNMELSNLTSKKGMYVQDATGAIQLRLSADHTIAFGTKVSIDLTGTTLGQYSGAVQISVANDKITTVSTGNTVEPKTVTMADFLANKYEGQYIALEGVQVAASDLSKTWVSGGAHTSINVEDAAGNKFVVFSAKYATYGAQTVAQGSGTIKGISSINNGTMQIIFAQESDFAGLTGERFGDPVTPDPEPELPTEGETATLSFANKAQRTEYSSSKQVWEQNGVKLVNDKASSTTAIGDYANPARFYKSSNITISTDLGVITAIEFTCSGDSKYYLTGTYNGATLKANGAKVTAVLTNPAQSFTFSNLANQVRVSELTITYIPNGATAKQSQDPSFHESTYSVVEGEAFDAPTVIGAQTTVTYTSSNTAVATVDANSGAVTVLSTGITTITATAAENEVYYGASASYTLTVTAKPVETDGAYTLLANLSDLKVGDKIVIAAKDYNVAMSVTQNKNNRGQAAITKNENTITFGTDVQILTVEAGKVDGTFAFNTGSGYLYAASSSENYLRTEATLSDNSSWKVEIAADGTTSLKAQGSSKRNVMQYNPSNKLFACYSSASQQAIAIYRLVE